MRQDFLDRLSLKMDMDYKGSNLKEFLKGALKTMARVDIESNSEHGIWKFLNNLSLLIDQVPEREQNVTSVIEGYMKQTSIKIRCVPNHIFCPTPPIPTALKPKAHTRWIARRSASMPIVS